MNGDRTRAEGGYRRKLIEADSLDAFPAVTIATSEQLTTPGLMRHAYLSTSTAVSKFEIARNVHARV